MPGLCRCHRGSQGWGLTSTSSVGVCVREGVLAKSLGKCLYQTAPTLSSSVFRMLYKPAVPLLGNVESVARPPSLVTISSFEPYRLLQEVKLWFQRKPSWTAQWAVHLPPGRGCAFSFLAAFFVYLLFYKIFKNITTPN